MPTAIEKNRTTSPSFQIRHSMSEVVILFDTDSNSNPDADLFPIPFTKLPSRYVPVIFFERIYYIFDNKD